MLSKSAAKPSTTESHLYVTSESLRLIVDDLLCGKPVSTVPKSIHLKLVPFLQEAKNNAIQSDNHNLERKINIIMKQLSYSSNDQEKTKKRKVEKEYNSYLKTQTLILDQERQECSGIAELFLSNKIKIDEIQKDLIKPICRYIKQKRNEATNNQKYQRAKFYNFKIEQLQSYFRNLPSSPKKENAQYIERLKLIYHEAILRKNKAKAEFEAQLKHLDDSQNKAQKSFAVEYAEIESELNEKENNFQVV